MRTGARLYFDNAATSHPKPPGVARAMADYAERLGASPGRGAYAEAREAGELMWDCREQIRRLINAESAEHIIFTLNTTDALNMAIRGVLVPFLDAGEPVHAVTTWMDHNSILRPFNQLRRTRGLDQTRVECDPTTGIVDPDAIRRSIRPETRLVSVVHASNVSGTLQPIAEVGRICREAGVPLLVDAAQTAGHHPIDMRAMNVDLLAFPGHKGLLGPLGTGVLAMRPGMERVVATTREGGTGSVSERDTQPETLPDKYETGSHNAIGIIGLREGVRWLLERGIEDVWAHEQSLVRAMLDGLAGDGEHGLLPGLRLLGPRGVADRVGVFSLVLEGVAPGEVAGRLEADHGVLTRAGLHCAPLAHRTMGTAPEQVGAEMAGATRLSLGPFLSEDDVRTATGAIRELCEKRVPATAH